jgi:uncharacterized protein
MSHGPAASPSVAAEPLAAIAGFAALLRDHGFSVGVAEQQAFVRAGIAVPVGEPRVVRSAWRSIACHGARDWRRWDELFDLYWHPSRVRGSTRVSGQTRPSRDLRQVVQALQQGLAGERRPGESRTQDAALQAREADGHELDPGRRAQGGASRTEALHDKRFSEWLPQDLSTLEQLAERIAQRLRRRLTRRWQARRHGRRLDVRRTLRASLSTGGLPLAPAWAEPRREPPKLFILVDVSRSMETHAQLFLRIARAFVGAARARVFVFHTRLAEVTPLLQRDSTAVQEKVNAVTAGFGGGTRIATSLQDFVSVHARAQLGRGARVWVLSDGFDADPPADLADSVAAVRGRGARITWFHPGDEAPASDAMRPCRPMVQHFIRLNRLADLDAATHWLA